MRNLFARFAAVIMAVAMVLLAIPATEVKADQPTITVHFKNTESWGSVGVYCWDSAQKQYCGGWPGTDISNTEKDGWYTATITDYPDQKLNIIFNDMGGTQTLDLICDLSKGTEFWVVPKEISDGKWACAIETSKSAAESGKAEIFEPQYPSKPTIKESPVVKGNKVTFYFECTNADTVAVAGSMNGWQATDMKKDGNVYSYTMELEAGTYQYKYIVNGKWYTDPINPNTADDGSGNTNSTFTIAGSGSGNKPADPKPETSVQSPVISGGKVTFNYKNANASKVELMCSAFGWTAVEMTKNGDVFTCTVTLENGDYEYKFLVDGATWINDPANSNVGGADGNNLFSVTNAPVVPEYTPTITQSILIDGNNVTFYYENPGVDKVELMCSAFDWQAVEMTKDGNVFSVTVVLDKGDHTYKFLVNGDAWINDPLNPYTDAEGNNIFNVFTSLPSTEDSEIPDESETPAPSETPDTTTPDNAGSEDADTDAPSATNPTPGFDPTAIIIIVIILAAGGIGYGAYVFIKKKKTQ